MLSGLVGTAVRFIYSASRGSPLVPGFTQCCTDKAGHLLWKLGFIKKGSYMHPIWISAPVAAIYYSAHDNHLIGVFLYQ